MKKRTRRKLVSKPIPVEKIIDFDWRSFLKPAFQEILHNGVIAFATPFESGGFIDDAWSDVETVIHRLPECRKIAKVKWGIELPEEKPGPYEKIDEANSVTLVPFLFYMPPSNTSSCVFIHHNIFSGEQADIVDTALRSHFGDKYTWKNKNPQKTIRIFCGTKVPPLTVEELYDQETLDELNKFALSFPEAQFKRVRGGLQWTSLNITRCYADYDTLKNRGIAVGLRWSNAHEYFTTNSDMLTPWVSPDDVEKDVSDWLGYKRDEIEQLEAKK